MSLGPFPRSPVAGALVRVLAWSALCAGPWSGPGTAAAPPPAELFPASARHVVVYQEAGRYACWPTDAGAWSWGDEIVVGFFKAYHKPDTPEDDHPYDRKRPVVLTLARSRDGGDTWTSREHPEIDGGVARTLTERIDFSHPDLAIRVREGSFYVSRDRGRTWTGPFAFPDFGAGSLTSRTDYVVNGRDECLFFLSSKREPKMNDDRDGAFAVRTRDGGLTFEFLGWMTGKPYATRTVMPATVRPASGRLVSILQRRFDLDLSAGFRDEVSWLDAYGSVDDGRSWTFLARIAYPDTILHNGNPPSLVQLLDGRLVTVYGVRAPPYGLRARVSRDGGRTWGPELFVRTDGRNWDLGYCRSFVRRDGRILTATTIPPQRSPCSTSRPPSGRRRRTERRAIPGGLRSGMASRPAVETTYLIISATNARSSTSSLLVAAILDLAKSSIA